MINLRLIYRQDARNTYAGINLPGGIFESFRPAEATHCTYRVKWISHPKFHP